MTDHDDRKPRVSSAPLPTLNEGTTTGVAVESPVVEAVPAHLLDGGEIVHFAVKPSPWFLLFVSGRFILFAIALAAFSYSPWAPANYAGTLFQAAIAIAALRIGWAMLEWASSLYVLTNRRILSVRGVGTAMIYSAPLPTVEKTWKTGVAIGAALGVGDIGFTSSTEGTDCWRLVRRPGELHERLKKAIRNSPGNGNHAS